MECFTLSWKKKTSCIAMSNRLILVAVWRGDNMRSILLALAQMGYTTTTVKVYKGRLTIKNETLRESIPVGERLWLPYANEPNDDESQEESCG